MSNRRNSLHAIHALALGALIVLPWQAGAQSAYPARAVHIVNPFAPGGTLDIMVRPIAERLSQRWGQPVVLDNKPGAAGAIGADFVAKAAPDGYTLLITLSNTHIHNVILNPKTPYDPIRDFEPVTQLCSGAVVFAARSSQPSNNAAELIAAAKASGKAMSYGSWGIGSTGHIFGEQLRRQSGLDLIHVPYKSDIPALIDLIGGTIDVSFSGPAAALAQVKAGKVKILAVTGTQRLSAFPEVPSFAEQGIPGMELTGWFAIFAPGKTPRAIVQKVSADINELLRVPEIRQRMLDGGCEPVGSTPEQFAAAFREAFPRWAELIRASGAKLEN